MACCSAGLDAAQSRGAVFIALVIGLFLLTLANRDLARAALSRTAAKNPWLPRMFGGVTLMLAAVFGVPFLRDVMGLSASGSVALAGAVGMLVARDCVAGNPAADPPHRHVCCAPGWCHSNMRMPSRRTPAAPDFASAVPRGLRGNTSAFRHSRAPAARRSPCAAG